MIFVGFVYPILSFSSEVSCRVLGTSEFRESGRERRRATWRGPRSFTALVPVAGVPLPELLTRLRELNTRLLESLRQVDDLHSFRLVAVHPEENTATVRVLLNVVHDRPLEIHGPALLRAVGPLLTTAFATSARTPTVAELPALLMRHRVRERTLHLGAIGLTVQDILANQRLKVAAETFVDQQLAAGVWTRDTPAEVIRHATRDALLARPSHENLPRGPLSPIAWPARRRRFVDLVASFAFPALGVLHSEIRPAIQRVPSPARRFAYAWAYRLWWLYGSLPTALAMLGVRLLERLEPDLPTPLPDEEQLQRLEASEDVDPKNEVTLWFPVRPTWLRRTLMRVILWGSERGCRHFWTDGRLSKIETIHYARILQVDRGETMVFLSDYDGGLNRYLGDFIGEGSNAVIPISSSVAGCPKTRWLFRPENPDEFGTRWRNLIRRYQLETSVWYSAYPLLTVAENLANVAFRNELFAANLPTEAAQQWARRL